ncbi:hypothetical protein ACQ4PT_001034 [Festuca glaucescens]
MICSKQPSKWTSKDRFVAKRLRSVADKLDSDKRAIIEQKSAFRSLLNVSPFNIPNELIDYVAQHTSPVLREFKVGKKQIVFTKDMVTKVFGIVSGRKPVVSLKRSEQSSLRDVYRGSNPRSDIPTTIKILTDCGLTDEDTIVRSWDLLCMATVVDPRSSNHVGMDYLGSMSDPSKTHEYAWDEYILELSMKEIVYMDHLEFPPNNYVMDYSLPRACHVKCRDFEFAVVNDFDRLSLNNKKVFGRRPFLDFTRTPYAVAAPEPVDVPEVNPSASLNEWLVFPSSQKLEVPERYKLLHEKHKAIFASDVDVATKNFAIGDTGEQHIVDSPLRSTSPRSLYSRIPEGISEEAWRRAPDPPSMELFSQDPLENIPDVAAPAAADKMEETELNFEEPVPLNVVKDVQVNGDDTVDADLNIDAAMAEGGEPVTPIEPKSPGVVIIESSSKDATTSPDTLAKKNRYKRAAKADCTPPKLKKIKDKLIVDPAAFDLDGCMKELQNINSKFKVLKDDLLYFPIVKNGHWITCCINICFEEFHIFDSMKTPKDSSLLEQYALNLIFMENFDGKLMAHFDNNAIPDHRRLVAASLIENMNNGNDAVETVMDEDLIKTKKK